MMKQIGSVITGLVPESPCPTGQLPIVTGSGGPPSLPRPRSIASLVKEDPRDELPPLVRAIVTEPTARLISLLRFDPAALDPRYHAAALKRLTELQQQIQPWLAPPASDEQIVRTLETIASTFQVSLPEEEGLMIYVAVLQKLSAQALKAAAVEICKTHKYKTMPLPAELLEAANKEQWQWQWFAGTLDAMIRKLERT